LIDMKRATQRKIIPLTRISTTATDPTI